MFKKGRREEEGWWMTCEGKEVGSGLGVVCEGKEAVRMLVDGSLCKVSEVTLLGHSVRCVGSVCKVSVLG